MAECFVLHPPPAVNVNRFTNPHSIRDTQRRVLITLAAMHELSTRVTEQSTACGLSMNLFFLDLPITSRRSEVGFQICLDSRYALEQVKKRRYNKWHQSVRTRASVCVFVRVLVQHVIASRSAHCLALFPLSLSPYSPPATTHFPPAARRRRSRRQTGRAAALRSVDRRIRMHEDRRSVGSDTSSTATKPTASGAR